jgi:hypothetical protein
MAEEFNLVHPEDDNRELLDLEGNPYTAENRFRWFDHQTFKYKNDRKLEYPPIEMYLDGIAKGDQAQIDEYIALCQAVKAKYPKYVYRNPQ